ncbi:DNA/RNA helicase protein [Dorcoceras hygrometricum]|uniref:DNA/RNA helicase protein n=1 Tax=Dorcoceras hygrometricum TaxID=472368 RepID=A0A2Z7AMV7_9LAMI|nr:DNA/RNA helicase protein [Dorcoceras hygrometricum]
MYPMKRTGDELAGSVMGEIFVLPHYKPIIGANEAVRFAPDPSNLWDREAIRVQKISHPFIEHVGYLEHKDPCVLHRLLGSGLIRIQGFVQEIAQVHGVNIPCRIDIYSGWRDLETVRSAITRGGLQFSSPPLLRRRRKGKNNSTATKRVLLGPDCGFFHNKSSGDVWDYIIKNKLQDPADKRFVICDKNLKIVFNNSPRVFAPDLSSLIRTLAYTDKLVEQP